jgi:hypothetical protein
MGTHEQGCGEAQVELGGSEWLERGRSEHDSSSTAG